MFFKVAVFVAAFAAINANVILSAINTGLSSSTRQQDGMGNYAFNYGIADGKGATNGRAEVGDAHGNRKGSYTITDVDGRARRVDYVADAMGFRVKVNTNEPGTALSAPAAALIASPYAPPVAPAVVAAPATVIGAGPLMANMVSAQQSVIGHGATIGVVPGMIGVPGILGAGIGKLIW